MDQRSFQFNSRRSCVYSTKGIVASSQPLASAVGIKLLNAGGNAADVAVGMAAALNVTEPCSTGIGGDMFVLYYSAKDKTVKAINGSGRSPKSLSLEKLRAKGVTGDSIPSKNINAVTVPGAAAGLVDTHKTFGSGKLTLSEVLQPAIDLAENGFSVSDMAALQWKGSEKLLQTASSNGNEMLLDGKAPQCGQIMPCLAETFRTLGKEGKKGYYSGRIAQAIVDLVQSKGGELTLEDLASHNSDFVEPIKYEFAGKVTVHECPPNGQGLTALIALGIVDALHESGKIPSILEMEHNSTEYLHVLIEALRLAFADAFAYICDPEHVRVPIEEILSKKYLATRAALVDLKKSTDYTHGKPIGNSDTVYFSAADSEGNACSFIISNYEGFGTGAIPKGCGFTLQNRGANFSLEKGHPNCIAGGKRPYHTIIPSMATNLDGSLYSCFGVMGGFNQPLGHVQAIINSLKGFSPQEALDAPRFTFQIDQTDKTGRSTVILIEEHVDREVVDALKKMGHKIEKLSGVSRTACGRGQIIQPIPQKDGRRLYGAGSDPRADGCAMPQI